MNKFGVPVDIDKINYILETFFVLEEEKKKRRKEYEGKNWSIWTKYLVPTF